MNELNEISIEITHDCPMKCIFCSSSAEHPSPHGELKLEEIKQILTDAKKLGATKFSISGGETFLHPDIFEIIKVASNMGLKILMYSCGIIYDDENRISIPESHFKKIYEISNGNITIVFDVQSHDEKVAEHLMGIENSLEMCLASVRNAVSSGINVETHFVPMKINYTHLLNYMDLAEELGVKKVSVLRFVPQGRGAENVEELLCTPENYLELQKTFLKIYQDIEDEKRSIELRLGHPIDFTFILDENREIESCRGGVDAPLILPNGDVHMCPAWKNLPNLKAGNIKEKSIIDIWNDSDFYLKFRELITEKYDKIYGFCKECEFFEKFSLLS